MISKKKCPRRFARLQETEKRLQSELQLYKPSYQDLNRKYGADVSALRERTEVYQYKLQDRDEQGLPRQKVARQQEPIEEKDRNSVKIMYDPATMDLKHLLKNIDFPNASPKEINVFINERLRNSSQDP
ncbi:hypothetical protein CCH79_00018995 [Gambusia affinis]|uniref:Uncharacterized protein n=1 Tax=Gambusia affinis TaxID=33528 RepID=A0A315W3I9_GAMAF|nr:hypothetical protein CCH79_00018995 [Gambusia affinis]